MYELDIQACLHLDAMSKSVVGLVALVSSLHFIPSHCFLPIFQGGEAAIGTNSYIKNKQSPKIS